MLVSCLQQKYIYVKLNEETRNKIASLYPRSAQCRNMQSEIQIKEGKYSFICQNRYGNSMVDFRVLRIIKEVSMMLFF